VKGLKMKRIVILYFALLALTACDNPKAIRHLLRTAQHLLQIDATQKPKEVNYLLGTTSSEMNDTTVIFANYLLPGDTALFILNAIYIMPQQLGFEGKLEYCTVNAYFYHNQADTTSKNI